jgi:hypothetical protein
MASPPFPLMVLARMSAWALREIRIPLPLFPDDPRSRTASDRDALCACTAYDVGAEREKRRNEKSYAGDRVFDDIDTCCSGALNVVVGNLSNAAVV